MFALHCFKSIAFHQFFKWKSLMHSYFFMLFTIKQGFFYSSTATASFYRFYCTVEKNLNAAEESELIWNWKLTYRATVFTSQLDFCWSFAYCGGCVTSTCRLFYSSCKVVLRTRWCNQTVAREVFALLNSRTRFFNNLVSFRKSTLSRWPWIDSTSML